MGMAIGGKISCCQTLRWMCWCFKEQTKKGKWCWAWITYITTKGSFSVSIYTSHAPCAPCMKCIETQLFHFVCNNQWKMSWLPLYVFFNISLRSHIHVLCTYLCLQRWKITLLMEKEEELEEEKERRKWLQWRRSTQIGRFQYKCDFEKSWFMIVIKSLFSDIPYY